MRLLSIDHLLQLHALSIHRYGGGTGVRDIGRVEAALATQIQEVFGQELYSTLEQKAEALIGVFLTVPCVVAINKKPSCFASLA